MAPKGKAKAKAMGSSPKRPAGSMSGADPVAPPAKRTATGKASAWHWEGSMLIRDYGSPVSSWIAGFDLDDTLVTTKSGKQHAMNGDDWTWWHPSLVKAKLHKLADEGYKLVVFTNQKGISGGQTDEKAFQARADNVQAALGLPLLVIAGTGDDIGRKPRTGPWILLERFNGDKKVQLEQSFFCGDAAGRPKADGKKKDFSDTDLKFALNVGVEFMTPEQCFFGKSEPRRPVSQEFPFDPRKLGVGVEKAKRQQLLVGDSKAELVLVVGPPGSGKSKLASEYFPDYVRVNQDTLKTKEKCLQAVKSALSAGKSAIVDNQNKEIATRKPYIDAAVAAGVPVRAVLMDVPKDFCFHMNVYRSMNAKSQEHRGGDKVPSMVIHSYYKNLQAPTTKEGISQIIKLDLSSFSLSHAEDAELVRIFLM